MFSGWDAEYQLLSVLSFWHFGHSGNSRGLCTRPRLTDTSVKNECFLTLMSMRITRKSSRNVCKCQATFAPKPGVVRPNPNQFSMKDVTHGFGNSIFSQAGLPPITCSPNKRVVLYWSVEAKRSYEFPGYADMLFLEHPSGPMFASVF